MNKTLVARIRKKVKDLEFKLFQWFLRRYCTQELDQWNRWKMETKYGPVFITISRQGDQFNWDKL